LRHNPKPRQFAPLNKFGKPSIVNMAAQISSLDMLVPETGNEHRCRNAQDQQPALPYESARNLE